MSIGDPWQAAASVTDTAATDATNIALQKSAQTFNADQAGIQRDWSAQQAQNQMNFNAAQAGLQRDFSQNQLMETEQYNTQMSDTAITRRAQDIKNAGFNPLLAVGQLGGASSPTATPGPSSAASAGIPGGASASSPAPAQVQGLLSNAAQLNLASAQAANLRQNTKKQGAETDAQEYMNNTLAMESSPDMVMKRQQALAAKYDMDYATASEVDAAVSTIRAGAKSANYDAQLKDFQTQLASMSVTAQRATLNTLIEMKNAVQQQQTQEAKNVLWVQSQPYLSKGIAMAQAVLTPVSSAAGAASSAASAVRNIAEAGAL